MLCLFLLNIKVNHLCCCSAAKSCLTLQPHGLQHTRLPCPSPSPRACSNSCPLRQWCHPTISSSVVPFSSCLQSFPASGSFPMSWLFTSGGQSIGASASASILSVNAQGWFPSELTGLTSLKSQGLSRVFSRTTVRKSHIHSIKNMKSPHPQCNILVMAIPCLLHKITWEREWSLFS